MLLLSDIKLREIELCEVIMLNDYTVDIEFVVGELRTEWIKSANYDNTTAFSRVRDTGSDLLMCCPFHSESKPSFGVNKEYPYLYNCFSCRSGGNLVNLVQHTYNCNYFEAMRIIRREFSDDLADIDISTILDEEVIETEELTEEDINKYKGKKHSYITNRGISDYTLHKYEIGYDEETTSITFPVRFLNGEPAFIVRRGVWNKFYNIPKDAPRGSVLYGLNYLVDKVDSCYIVEGMVDVLSCYEAGIPSVGLGGRILSDVQAKELIKAGIKEVTLLLDNDKWGVIGTIEAYKVLEKYPITVKVGTYPTKWGVDCMDCELTDPNDLLKAGLLKDIKIVPYIVFHMDTVNIKHLRGTVK